MSEEGRIVKGVGGLYTVRLASGTVTCRARGAFRHEDMTPLVGDYVKVEDGVIEAIAPRRNRLIRPACANIDKLILVTALSSPDPAPSHLDKMLAIARYHGITPVLVFNKCDLEDVCGLRALYADLPYTVYECCAASDDPASVQPLRDEIRGCTVAFSGVSGVGKSTLINLLDPARTQQTGGLSEKLGRGKHTTRCTELFEMCGGEVMDTPGFSQLLLEYFDMEKEHLAECFPEFEPYFGKCRFSDCRHIKEPDCAVREAVARGEIKASRYENFRAMFEELH